MWRTFTKSIWNQEQIMNLQQIQVILLASLSILRRRQNARYSIKAATGMALPCVRLEPPKRLLWCRFPSYCDTAAPFTNFCHHYKWIPKKIKDCKSFKLSNHELLNHEIFNHELFNPKAHRNFSIMDFFIQGVEKFMVETSEIEKSGVKISYPY